MCLASSVDTRGTSEGRLEGELVSLTPVDGCTCEISGSLEPTPGLELEQIQTLTATSDLRQEFVELWAPCWGKHFECTLADWDRIVAFGKAPMAGCCSPFQAQSRKRA